MVKLSEAVAEGESIGFEGRNKLIWECYQGGYSEATIVDLFLAYGDATRYGVLEEDPDRHNGYRLKARFNPFENDKLSMMDPKCEKVTQWCDWVNCYRAERFRSVGGDAHSREQHEQLKFGEFRERGRALLQEAIDSDKNYSVYFLTAMRLIAHVETTVATKPDVKMTEVIHQALDEKEQLPAEHFIDSGYIEAQLLCESQKEYQVELVGPVKADQSWQAKRGARIQH